MLKAIGKVFDFIKSIFNIVTFRVEWGEESVEKHPKLNKFYEKGFWARIILFMVSLIISCVSILLIFAIYNAIFSGELSFILVLIFVVILLNFPIKLCSGICGIALYHFRVGVQRGIKNIKKKLSDNDEETSQQVNEDTIKNVSEIKNELNNDAIQNNVVQVTKPKTRSVSSLLFFIIAGILTLAIPLSVVIIPFTAGVWLS